MFHAFLSYSHRADAELAALLQRALQRLGTPWWRRAPVRVFRDDATLAASAALWPSIQAGLEGSQFFVLLASPAAAASPWVQREVQWWLAHRPRERLLLAITGGDVSYDAAARDFDWAVTNCLPPVLRGVFGAEPLWVDLRFAATLKPLSLRHTRLRSAALSLAGAVRGVDKDQLENDDLRAHRRSLLAAGGALTLIAALGLSTLLALQSAGTQRENARSNELQAESRRLAAEAMDQLALGGPGIEPAVFKAVLAWRLAPTAEARAAIVRVNERTAAVARVLGSHTRGAYKIALSPDGRVLATAGREGTVLRYDVASGKLVGQALAGAGWVNQLRFSADGSHLLFAGHDRLNGSDATTLALFRLVDESALPLGTKLQDAWAAAVGLDPGRADCVAVSTSGRWLALGGRDVLVLMATSSGALQTLRLPSSWRLGAVGFEGDERVRLLLENVYGGSARAARAELASTTPRLQLGPPRGRGQLINGASCGFSNFSGDGRRVAWREGAWRIGDQEQLLPEVLDPRLTRVNEYTGHHAPELDATGTHIAIGLEGVGYVWNTGERRVQFTLPKQKDGHGPPLALAADGRRLAALQDGTPVVLNLADGSRAAPAVASECGAGEGLSDRCLERLCERVTDAPDPQRWQQLLGQRYAALLQAAKGRACAAPPR